jgi:hypothetical protein
MLFARTLAFFFNKDYILLTDILEHCLYLDFTFLSIFCGFHIVYLTVFIFVFYLMLFLGLLCNLCYIIFLVLLSLVLGCNWPCLAVVKHTNI